LAAAVRGQSRSSGSRAGNRSPRGRSPQTAGAAPSSSSSVAASHHLGKERRRAGGRPASDGCAMSRVGAGERRPLAIDSVQATEAMSPHPHVPCRQPGIPPTSYIARANAFAGTWRCRWAKADSADNGAKSRVALGRSFDH
jgi:hypothetical protein